MTHARGARVGREAMRRLMRPMGIIKRYANLAKTGVIRNANAIAARPGIARLPMRNNVA